MWVNARGVSVVLVFVLAVGLCGPAAGGTTLRYQVTRDDKTSTMAVLMQPGAVRVEGAGVAGHFEWMVYHGADNTLYAVNPKRKLVLALDEAGINRLEQRLNAKRARLRQQLKDMPAQKRRFVKSQVGGLLERSTEKGGGLRVKMTGKTTRVAGVICRTGRIMAHGRAVGAFCVASAEALGIEAAAFDAYQGLYRLINGLRSAMVGESDLPNFATLGGVPVRVRLEYSGAARTLQAVTHQPLPDGQFQIPEDYQLKQPADLLAQAPGR